MRREFGTTVIMITHDLGLLSSVADDVMVMYAGHRMELGPSRALFGAPAHPYTAGLLRSSPANYRPGTELVPIPGRPPSLLATRAGCVFAPRCARPWPSARRAAPAARLRDGLRGAVLAAKPATPANRRRPRPSARRYAGRDGESW